MHEHIGPRTAAEVGTPVCGVGFHAYSQSPCRFSPPPTLSSRLCPLTPAFWKRVDHSVTHTRSYKDIPLSLFPSPYLSLSILLSTFQTTLRCTLPYSYIASATVWKVNAWPMGRTRSPGSLYVDAPLSTPSTTKGTRLVRTHPPGGLCWVCRYLLTIRVSRSTRRWFCKG